MNIAELKQILKNKNAQQLREIICKVYTKVPEARGYIDIITPIEKQKIRQNTEQLLKRYKRQLDDYLMPDILIEKSKEEEAYALLERIRKKNITAEFTIDCELQFVESCKTFILTYGYFDEDYYITMEEVFENACIKIKAENLVENYREIIERFIQFGYEYGLEFKEICKDLGIYKTLT